MFKPFCSLGSTGHSWTSSCWFSFGRSSSASFQDVLASVSSASAHLLQLCPGFQDGACLVVLEGGFAPRCPLEYDRQSLPSHLSRMDSSDRGLLQPCILNKRVIYGAASPLRDYSIHTYINSVCMCRCVSIYYFYFCMQMEPGLCMFIGNFPRISVWPVDPREDVTALQTLLIKCFVASQNASLLMHWCMDAPPPTSALPFLPSFRPSSPSSTALRVGISCLFLWKQIPAEEWVRLCIFLFVFGGMVFAVLFS